MLVVVCYVFNILRLNGEWKCRGEDVDGNSPEDAEITFREKAPLLINESKLKSRK